MTQILINRLDRNNQGPSVHCVNDIHDQSEFSPSATLGNGAVLEVRTDEFFDLFKVAWRGCTRTRFRIAAVSIVGLLGVRYCAIGQNICT
jgi:hypothetical protein